MMEKHESFVHPTSIHPFLGGSTSQESAEDKAFVHYNRGVNFI